jgi:N-acetylglucosamine-6-phosphate deacetylase
MTSDLPRRWFRAPLIRGGRLVEDGLLRIDGGRIGWLGRASDDPKGARTAERLGGILAPGYVDVHCHGGGGIDVLGPGIEALLRGGRQVVAETVDALRAFAGFEARRGVAAVVPTAVSIPLEAIPTWLRAVDLARRRQQADRRAALAAGRRPPVEATIVGANLEGPALAHGRRGAHDPAFLVTPQRLLERLTGEAVARRVLRIVTIAPEGEGGLEAVAGLARLGVVVSVGHTDASTEVARAAYAAGARSTTHLFNAMPPLHHRTPGPVGVALAEDRAFVELIADGIHVHPLLFGPLFRVLANRLLFVSDAIALAGRGDGRGRVGPLEVTVRGREARLADGTLAGSVTPLDEAVAVAVEAGVPLAAALGAASAVPARLLGLRGLGALRVGARADLVLVDEAGRRHGVLLGGGAVEMGAGPA